MNNAPHETPPVAPEAAQPAPKPGDKKAKSPLAWLQTFGRLKPDENWSENWTKGEMWQEMTTTSPEKAREAVKMDPDSQRKFVGIIYERYKTMRDAPEPDRQALDTMTEWTMTEIAAESGFFKDLPKDATEEQVRQAIDSNIPNFNLQSLHEDTRYMAYYLVQATQIEMLAAAGYIPKDIALKDSANSKLSPVALQQQVAQNDVVLGLVRRFSGNVPDKGPLRDLWNQAMKQGYVTDFDPTSVAYRSAYTDKRFGGLKGERVYDIIQNNTHLIQEFDKAATDGIDVHHSLYGDVADSLGLLGSGDASADLYRPKKMFVENLNKILKRDYGDRRLDDFESHERYQILLQASREAIGEVGGKQLSAILQKESTNVYAEWKMSKAKDKVKALKEGDKSDLEKKAEGVGNKIQSLEVGQREIGTAHEDAMKANEAATKVLEIESERDSIIAEKTPLDTELESLTTIVNPATPPVPPRIPRTAPYSGAELKRLGEIRKKTEALQTRIDGQNGKIDEASARLKTTKDIEEKKRKAVYDMLSGWANEDELKKIVPSSVVGFTAYPPGYPPGSTVIEESELQDFIRSQRTKQADELKEGQKATKEKQSVGSAVLETIELRSNEVIESFVTGNAVLTATDPMKKYEEFIGLLNINDQRVLTPERVAKLLIMNLGLRGFETQNIDPKSPDFPRQLDKIFASFQSKDGFARGRAVANIYYDRFKAILDKGDVFADTAIFERPQAQADLEPVRVAQENHVEVLARYDKIAGVNATVVSSDNLVLVASGGQAKIYQENPTNTGGRLNLEEIGDLGLEIQTTGLGDRVVVTNPGSEDLQLMRSRFLHKEDYTEQGLKLLVGTTPGTTRDVECEDDVKRQVGIDATGVYFVRDGGVTFGMKDYIDAHPNLLFTEGAGRYYVERVVKRGENLAKVDEKKGPGFKEEEVISPKDPSKEPLSPDHLPTELHWTDPTVTQSELVIHFEEASKVSVERKTFDTATNTWKSAPIIPMLSDKMSLEEFDKIPAAGDTEALKERMYASAFDILRRMTPEQRLRIAPNFTPTGIDINVEKFVPFPWVGRVTVDINRETGDLVIIDRKGVSRSFQKYWDQAAIDNDTVRLDTVPVASADIRTQENLKTQGTLGKALINALHEYHRKSV